MRRRNHGWGPLDAAERADLVSRSPLLGYYEKAFDRISAYELLAERAAKQAQDAPQVAEVKTKKTTESSAGGSVVDALGGIAGQVYKSTVRQA